MQSNKNPNVWQMLPLHISKVGSWWVQENWQRALTATDLWKVQENKYFSADKD